MVSEKINKWRARRECHHTCAWPRNTCCAVSKSMPANKFVLKRRLVQTGTAPRNEPHEEDATWKQREEVPPASPGERPQEKPSPPAPWSRTLSLRNRCHQHNRIRALSKALPCSQQIMNPPQSCSDRELS
ncbi:uncharacterized protein LOC106557741 isoform X9 [Canis lupus familiaris]|uniref:uncharacterized protein LOC112669474 isoform X9 n=1 Tax=Canis lupus dingo TaxID=286419 RepID=UPI0018F2A492|nr:uncharacterized protein LOC112669474 isoform X9 [Canis lupus dingo]XP_038290880.1 uncharacterized protein LOC106557741 isoform X9 [Canis lupus familiaris]XP_038429295.1 uncharacterized protein LOC106557741 isoform X9 [Canis lupus familiaris]